MPTGLGDDGIEDQLAELIFADQHDGVLDGAYGLGDAEGRGVDQTQELITDGDFGADEGGHLNDVEALLAEGGEHLQVTGSVGRGPFASEDGGVTEEVALKELEAFVDGDLEFFCRFDLLRQQPDRVLAEDGEHAAALLLVGEAEVDLDVVGERQQALHGVGHAEVVEGDLVAQFPESGDGLEDLLVDDDGLEYFEHG